jgi:parvulin-like peptidyl-prolyl isomerase
VVEARIEDEARQRGGTDAMRRFYEEQGLDLAVVRLEYARELAPKLLVSKVVKAMRVVDEDALRREYQRTFAKTQYHLSHIAYRYGQERAPPDLLHRLRTEAMEKAVRAVTRLRAGGDFAAMAKQESQDALTYHRGGDMGYATGDDMPPEMREAVLKLEVGAISDPVDNQELGSIHVFKVNEVLSHRGFEECREELIRSVKEREPDFVEIQDALFRLQTRARVEAPTTECSRKSDRAPPLQGSAPVEK